MSKEYRPWTPEQSFLLPPSPMDWLPEGHLDYFVLELVRELDVSATGCGCSTESSGRWRIAMRGRGREPANARKARRA